MVRRTVIIPDDHDEQLTAVLDHGDNYSVLVRESVRRLLDDVDNESDLRAVYEEAKQEADA